MGLQHHSSKVDNRDGKSGSRGGLVAMENLASAHTLVSSTPWLGLLEATAVYR